MRRCGWARASSGAGSLANSKLNEGRRRVQNETIGHRGRKDDPLYLARRLLTKAHERLDERGDGPQHLQQGARPRDRRRPHHTRRRARPRPQPPLRDASPYKHRSAILAM
jgi:hypothetical protein